MRKPGPYEISIQDAFVEQDGEYPIRACSEKKAYYWMRRLFDRMNPLWNGYNISKQLRFQMEHSPESRYRRLPELSEGMVSLLDLFCGVLSYLQRNVLSHYPSGKSINLMGEVDRDLWDAGCELIRDMLWKGPVKENEYMKDDFLFTSLMAKIEKVKQEKEETEGEGN